MSQPGIQRTLTTLWRTPNTSAADLLEDAVVGPSPAVRQGAIAALVRRRDEPSQQAFLRVFAGLNALEVASLGDVSKRFSTTLRKVLAHHDLDSARLACHFIAACRAFDEFPALVTAAADPSHPGGVALAQTALDLARALHDDIVAYRRAPSGRDPSFARRWALTALTKAVDQFQQHRRVELLEAFLLITTPNNETLTRLLSHTDHPGHEPLMALLRTSPSVGAIEVLAKLYDDPGTPLPLLEIAAQRTDLHFRELFLHAVGYPVSARTLENVGRLKRLAMLEKPSADWFTMPSESQAVAVELVMASRFSRRTKLAIVDEVLAKGSVIARSAACAALGEIDLPEATTRLERMLTDGDPNMVAFAAIALRKQGVSSAVDRLSRLLDHDDHSVRETARHGLRDFTFLRYAGKFDDLDERERRDLGRIVRDTDSSAIEQVRREIGGPTLARKLRGLQMAAAIGLVDQLEETIVKQATHQDAAVRAEAIMTLAQGSTNSARRAVEAATQDANALVRNRAGQALREMSQRQTQGEGGR
ncbi:HEAT repeat domain-containing protein [Aeoliella sp. SH292]|uniref:HEAT repeat domain-containing protein n=1 Tax=Aeoliella sp. SH292 TaxID=3454464 RepID=UPI003F98397A